MPAPTSHLRSALSANPTSSSSGSGSGSSGANVFGIRSFRTPVGPLRSGVTGFLFGLTIASAYGYYYLVTEYKGASTSMLNSVRSLSNISTELSVTLSRVTELERELKALRRDAETRATKEELARSDAFYKQAFIGLHDEILELRSRIANGTASSSSSSSSPSSSSSSLKDFIPQWRAKPTEESIAASSIVESFWPWSSSNKQQSSTIAADEKAALAASSTTAPPPPKNKFVTELNPTGIKPCCACPETKSARDGCFLQHGGYDGDAEEKCKELVAAHRTCMAKLGFKV